MRTPGWRLIRVVSAVSITGLAAASCGSGSPGPSSNAIARTTTAHSAQVRWMIASGALRLLSASARQVIESNAQNLVIYQPTQTPAAMAAIPVATFRSFAALSSALAAGTLSPRFKYVLLDLEAWRFTPQNEQADPAHYYVEAARLLRQHGLKLIAAPGTNVYSHSSTLRGRNYQRMLASGIFDVVAPHAAIFSIQSQSLEFEPSVFASYVSQAASALRSANPAIAVFAGISTNPPAGTATTSQLADVMKSVSSVVKGFWLNVPQPGPSCPNCKELNVAAANGLLER
ncbi:MAG: hypothetical protein M0Z91_09280 [Actinomycetota bacterium]|nr:hypothetical protein [Actinomycetota bacterium]